MNWRTEHDSKVASQKWTTPQLRFHPMTFSRLFDSSFSHFCFIISLLPPLSPLSCSNLLFPTFSQFTSPVPPPRTFPSPLQWWRWWRYRGDVHQARVELCQRFCDVPWRATRLQPAQRLEDLDLNPCDLPRYTQKSFQEPNRKLKVRTTLVPIPSVITLVHFH